MTVTPTTMTCRIGRKVNGAPHLVVPYTMVTNDAKFLSGDAFSGRNFGEFLIDSFDVLHEEAKSKPRMMSVGLHSRIIGHPRTLSWADPVHGSFGKAR